MKIAYYMPFKPLGHTNPSGDLVTGTEIHQFLNREGHHCTPISDLRCRWLYYRPGLWLKILAECRRIEKECTLLKPDIWLTYHSYYKAPDILGYLCSKRLNIPYIIFQGIYSTKRRKKLKTRLGYSLNKRCLLAADTVFTNKKRDEQNLLRLLPPERVCYIPPGIHTDQFTFCGDKRREFRRKWRTNNKTVVMSAAMFRPGVKTEGLRQVITSCAELVQQGRNIQLVIAGNGSCREELHHLAEQKLPGRVIFLGRVPRDELYQYYSAADIFAFPGIEESLGMVYLEAQSCGLPVVAYSDWGGSEAVVDGHTGLLSPARDPDAFTTNIGRFIESNSLKNEMSHQAASHIRSRHELDTGYKVMTEKLLHFYH